MAMTPTVHTYYVMVSALQIQISDENSTNMWPAKNNKKSLHKKGLQFHMLGTVYKLRSPLLNATNTAR